ncbi:hypothetical protein M5X17_00135 [Paenibacillus alvei]|uniref:hypothetical protein n=2 Tax=Paenibacillus alvei TaxID=44250 RepID=UPI000289C73A|nr:hypothetical protein [Paenibacillus alvei]EJW14365.1 hypothetical protein PAV_14c00580 [Paenibacillus alvei DSM 29]MCY9539399.1 hypothetical protein [Paenibacillus alvei]MCY9732163.1 hypothetical protein [Paenibacillus alvei]MEC0079823.1 hypothetical protein [Paenibacillus alvei]
MATSDNKTMLETLGIDLDKPVTICGSRFPEDSGKDLKIIIQGESEVFGGNDLKLRAALDLIGSFDFKFQEEDDPYIRDKTYITLIDRIGAMMKSYWLDPSMEKKMNIEAVKDFIEFVINEKMHESREFKNLLDQEDEF